MNTDFWDYEQLYRLLKREEWLKRRKEAGVYLESLSENQEGWPIAMKGMTRVVYVMNWNEHCKDLPIEHAFKIQREFIDVFHRALLSLHDEMMEKWREESNPSQAVQESS